MDTGGLNLTAISNHPLTFGTNNAPRMTIDSSGNVGIKNTSPSDFLSWQQQLVVGNGSADAGITIYHGSGGGNQGAIVFADGNTGTDRYRGSISYNGADEMKFFTSTSERMRIDSSGTIISTIDSSTSTANKHIKLGGGTSTTGNGQYIQFSSSSNAALGSRIEGTREGAGGSSNLKIYTTNTGGSVLERMRITSGGIVEITNGIKLGGTAAANLLDDYEEGTWTPAVSAPFSPSGVTYNFRGGSFVRIGGKVWVRMGLNVANVGTGGSGNLFVTGLPFTAANVGAYQEPTAGANGGRWVTASNAGNVYAFVQNSTSQFVFRTMASNADTVLNYSEIQGGAAGGGTWFTLQCFYDIA
jgi:hypothetical protein